MYKCFNHTSENPGIVNYEECATEIGSAIVKRRHSLSSLNLKISRPPGSFTEGGKSEGRLARENPLFDSGGHGNWVYGTVIRPPPLPPVNYCIEDQLNIFRLLAQLLKKICEKAMSKPKKKNSLKGPQVGWWCWSQTTF